jgi:Rps23 Pro-64 3,4-dihydroxylase Tpa1-like proline 4-hydroxylase
MPSSSDCPPLLPATYANPLTNPYMGQAAAYECGEFYIHHSDNTLNLDGLRGDHLLYTCILYCHNEPYQPGDGGVLRLHLNSQDAKLTENLVYPPSVLTDYRTVDIEPIHGRLLIFDSALLHSVEKVLQDHYTRLALTVWITRPED